MQIASALATLVFVVVSAIVGIRLLVLAARTRELPELAIGTALLFIGGFGYPMAVVAPTEMVSPEMSRALMGVTTWILAIGLYAVVVFTWAVFRRGQRWALVLMSLMGAGYLVHATLGTVAVVRMTGRFDLSTTDLTLLFVGQVLNGITFSWAAIEAYRYWWMLRKRSSIGLGDSVTTNRFLLWAVASTCTVGTNTISWWLISSRIDMIASPGTALTVALLSLLACICQYLAFFPPRSYLAWVRGDATEAAA